MENNKAIEDAVKKFFKDRNCNEKEIEEFAKDHLKKLFFGNFDEKNGKK